MSLKSSEEYLICPLTLKLFNDPVLADDGNTYEREAITLWIIEHGTSPKTKKALRLNQLIPNNTIKNAVENFKQTYRIDYGENRQILENLDVPCVFCGIIEKFNKIKDHKSQCSLNPNNIQQFQLDDGENVFTITPKNKSNDNKKVYSFHNPLSRRTDIQTTPQIINQNNRNIQLPKQRCPILLTKRRIKYYLIIILILLLTLTIIILSLLYVQCRGQHSITERTTTTTTILTTTSTSQFLCLSAQWESNGTTIISNLDHPHDIGIDNEDNLIVANSEKHHLEKYFSNGTQIILLNNTKSFNIFIDKYNNIYFTDIFNDQIKKINSNDETISIVAGFGGTGSALDQLKLEGQTGIYVDQNQTLYISDTGNHRVIKYYLNSTSGILVAGGHGQGSDSNQLNTPYGIYIDEIHEIGTIYICDEQNHRIQKWIYESIEGITVAQNNEQLNTPMSILLESTSTQIIMYISTFSNNQILKWIPYEKQAKDIIISNIQSNQLSSPRGIKFDKNWNLFVADTGNNRIQKFLFNTSSC